MSPTPPAKLPGLQPGGDKIDMAGPEDSVALPAADQGLTGKRGAARLGGKLSDAFFDPLPAEDLDAWEGRSP
jgi:hypothetical protein